MSQQRMGPERRLDTSSVGVVVCAVADERWTGDPGEALTALVAHTPEEAPIVVAGLQAEAEAALSEELVERVLFDRPAPRLALGELLTNVSQAANPADIVVVDLACRVPSGWLGALRAAAHSGDTVATASPLSAPRVSGQSEGESDAAIIGTVTPTYPRLQLGGPSCLYVRRSALQLLDGLPIPEGALDRVIERWCADALGIGLINVLADDLYVGRAPELIAEGSAAVSSLRALDEHDLPSPLQRAVAVSRAAIRGLTVTIDGRSLNRAVGGTQRYALEMILALHRHTDLSLRVVLPPDPAPEVSAALAQHPLIKLISYNQSAAGVPLSDVVHRPQQVFSAADVTLLRLLGRRLVVTHQDLIAYHNPTYHPTPEAWTHYRRVTRQSLAVADRVVFFSQASHRDAEAEDLVTGDRSDVIGIALDDPFPASPQRPARIPEHADFILCLGADYTHKNRPFAIRVMQELRTRHGWAGELVLAGVHVDHGSSACAERALLEADPALDATVFDLGGITEPERAWLLSQARAVIVPSVVEGFGLVPLEAAAARTPCLFAAQTSLREVLSASLATLVAWDASASSDRVIGLLVDEGVRADHLRRLEAEAARWSWEQLASQLEAGYQRAIRAPERVGSEHQWQELERERAIDELNASRDELLIAYSELLGHLGDRAAIARDDGFFSEAQQRGLLRIGSRPALARSVMWPFGLLGGLRPPR